MASINDETFRLELGGEEVPIPISYEVSSGILTVPAGFSMTLGHAGLVADIMRHYPMFTPFNLYVGDVKVQTGEVDKDELAGGTASMVKITGRDMLKWLVDSYVESDRTFAEKSYLQLTETALAEVGLSGRVIALDNTANRLAITGSQTVATSSGTTEEGNAEVTNTEGATKEIKKSLKAEVGTTWWNFLSEQYRRAGLFLWADVKGGFILSRPRGDQVPLYRIVRRRNWQLNPGDVTVLGNPQFFEDATQRYTECVVLGRAGGKKQGRSRVSGSFIDDEMVKNLNPLEADWANGGTRNKRLVVKDTVCRTIEQANYLAKRKIAESRRNGWYLSYTVSGHTAPAAVGGGRLVWQPDTVVYVVDEELGFDEPMYIESCTYSRAPKTTTKLRLMRLADLIFAEEDETIAPKKKRRIRVGKTEKFNWVVDPQRGNLPVAKWQQESGTQVDAVNSDLQQRGSQVVVTARQ